MTPTEHIDWHGPEFTAEIEREVSNRMFRASVIILSEAQKSMATRDKGGTRAHKRLKSGKISEKQWSRWQQTRRSAPGQAPAVQSGLLQRSFGFMSGGLQKLSTLRWRLGAKVYAKGKAGVKRDYAGYLEHGTPGGQMAARPFLQPAVDKMKPKIERLFAREKL